MIFEKLHRYYKKGAGLKGVPEERHTEHRKAELSDYEYLGYIGDYELLGYQTAMAETSVVAIKRDLYSTVLKDEPVPKIRIDGIGGYHGSELNTNCVVQFRKQDLINLIEYMGDKDTIVVMNTDYSSKHREYMKEEMSR